MRNIRVADPQTACWQCPADPPRPTVSSFARTGRPSHDPDRAPAAGDPPAVRARCASGPTPSGDAIDDPGRDQGDRARDSFPAGSPGSSSSTGVRGRSACIRPMPQASSSGQSTIPAAMAAGKHTVRAMTGSVVVASLAVTVTSRPSNPRRPRLLPRRLRRRPPTTVAPTVAPAPTPTPGTTAPPRQPDPDAGARDACADRHARAPGRAAGQRRHPHRPRDAHVAADERHGLASLKARADLAVASPNLSNQDDPNDVTALAKALVYARPASSATATETIVMLKAAVGTEYPGDTLGIARGVAPLALAADLVGWRDPAWMSWLGKLRTWANPDRGYCLISMHEKRPMNWGTHAGAGRIAVDLYLGDMTDLARAARRSSRATSVTGPRTRVHLRRRPHVAGEPLAPVGINPMGASIPGVTLDGIMPDDMRRGGSNPSSATTA